MDVNVNRTPGDAEDLKALGPSTEGAATWAHLLVDLHHRDEVATAHIALARTSDGAGFAANVSESRTVLAAVSSDLIDAGFKVHDDCRCILRIGRDVLRPRPARG